MINVPTPPLDKISDVISDFDNWKFRQFERFYNKDDYRMHWWSYSRLISTSVAAKERLSRSSREEQEHALFDIKEQPAQITLQIMEMLKSSVDASGAEMLLAVIIPKWYFHFVKQNLEPPYQDLLDAVYARYDTIRTDQHVLSRGKSAKYDQLFLKQHYSSMGNEAVAEKLKDKITVIP